MLTDDYLGAAQLAFFRMKLESMHAEIVAHAQQASRTPGSRVHVFEACGHCPHIERAEAFNQLATTFLS